MQRTSGIVALQLGCTVDEPAGVDGVVGRVEDAARVEHATRRRRAQLIVGRARDRFARQPLRQIFGDGAAQRAGRKNVAGQIEDLLGVHLGCADLFGDGRAPIGIDVADGQFRARLLQLAREVRAHVTDTLNRDVKAV